VVLQHPQLLLVVQQVEHLAAVDLEERAVDLELALVLAVDLLEDVASCLGVNALGAVHVLGAEVSAHCERFAAACLTIGKAHGVATFENGAHKWLG